MLDLFRKSFLQPRDAEISSCQLIFRINGAIRRTTARFPVIHGASRFGSRTKDSLCTTFIAIGIKRATDTEAFAVIFRAVFWFHFNKII